MGNFFGGKPIAGAMLACVPLGALAASKGYADRRKTILVDNKNSANTGSMSKTFRKKGVKKNMDDASKSVSEALAKVLGVLNEEKGGNELRAAIESMAKDLANRMSVNNVIDDLSKFNISNEKVSLSASDFDSEKDGLASAFLKSKKSGCYDTDWVSNFSSSMGTKNKSDELNANSLSVIFGGMKEIASAGLTNFFTVKDKASGDVVGQINLTSDPFSLGTVKLSAWADNEENFKEAFHLAFKGLSKNQGVNKVVVSAADSGRKVDDILKKVKGEKSERFKKLKVVENENHMELVRDSDDNYMLLNYTIKTVNGEKMDLKASDVQQQKIPLENLETAKVMISGARKMSELISSDKSASSKRPELVEKFKVVDSFVAKTTDYEFTESK